MFKKALIGLVVLLALSALAAEAAGGFFIFQADIDDQTHTILSDGTFDTNENNEAGVGLIIALNPSTGANRIFAMNLEYAPGDTEFDDLDGLRFELTSQGGLTVRRISGTKTYSITVRGIWIS